jgi:2-C-methyl-D-erythritol 4-phosphate cytidylyltransferase
MNVAIIAAAGQGTRFGGDRAKQFLELAGKPIIIHTVQAFEQSDLISEIVVVLPAEDEAGLRDLVTSYGLRKVTQVVSGGRTRAESVLHGFREIQSADIVTVHDGVRPLVSGDEIRRTVEAAREHGAAILVAPVTDTIKQVAGGMVERTVPRNQLRRALTPQCFRYSLLDRIYQDIDVLDPEITDESMLCEKLGLPVALVEGSARNIKITQPEDLALAEMLIKKGS